MIWNPPESWRPRLGGKACLLNVHNLVYCCILSCFTLSCVRFRLCGRLAGCQQMLMMMRSQSVPGRGCSSGSPLTVSSRIRDLVPSISPSTLLNVHSVLAAVQPASIVADSAAVLVVLERVVLISHHSHRDQHRIRNQE